MPRDYLFTLEWKRKKKISGMIYDSSVSDSGTSSSRLYSKVSFFKLMVFYWAQQIKERKNE